MFKRLRLTSCLAENTHALGRALADYLAQRLGLTAEFVEDVPWQEREQLLDSGQVHLGWICGLLYAWKASQPEAPVRLLAAPVPVAPRYRQRPVYYSDLVVRRASPYRSFADLRGATWIYNEPRSYSGYFVMGHHLAQQDLDLDYFGGLVESGAHLRSLALLRQGQGDVTAIDSTVLDDARQREPALMREIRILASLGPSPIPPWVVSSTVPRAMRRRLRRLFLEMHSDPLGGALLTAHQVSRFAAGDAEAYEAIRLMAAGVGR